MILIMIILINIQIWTTKFGLLACMTVASTRDFDEGSGNRIATKRQCDQQLEATKIQVAQLDRKEQVFVWPKAPQRLSNSTWHSSYYPCVETLSHGQGPLGSLKSSPSTATSISIRYGVWSQLMMHSFMPRSHFTTHKLQLFVASPF